MAGIGEGVFLMKRPNILYIHSHDTGRYIQPYGYAVPTPSLQRLAEQGVLFRQAFCAGPTCSPSRASLLTGTWPHCNGMLGLAHRGSRLRDPAWHLANYLRGHGYRTALSGIQHETDPRDPAPLGYEEWLTSGRAPAGAEWNGWFAAEAEQFLSGQHERPFFLSCGFGLTHRTGTGVQWHNDEASPVGDPRYCRPPAPLPDTPDIRRDFADFVVAAGRLDRCMGRVFQALDHSGLAESTLVICTTDHGIAYPFMKCNLTDHGIGVMLMLRGPGFSGGRVVDGMVSQIDVFPTICRLAGLPIPEWVRGRPLQPLSDGATDSLHEEIYAEVTYHAALEPMRAVRTSRHKYIRRFGTRLRPVMPNCDDSVSKNEMRRFGWADRTEAAESLFDLMFDPNEACNLAGDPASAAVLADLRGRLERWMKQNEDPLLGDTVRPWPGMVVNPVDDPSAQGPTVPA